MTRSGAFLLGLIVMAAVGPTDGRAAELCRVRSRSLVVRDVCKPREETLGPERKTELGMAGKAGARGRHGPGTGDLRVLDADGDEVGVVAGLTSYYGSASAVGRVTLPGKAAPEFVVADVDGLGLSPANRCEDVGRLYREADCSGTPLVRCEDGTCVAPEDLFARQLFREDAATACYVGDPSETEAGPFFRRVRILGSTPQQATQQCQLASGTLVGSLTQCRPFLYCGQCCIDAPFSTGVPLHFVDTTVLGTPPFRLSR